MDYTQVKYALVTGASSGIGTEYCFRLAKKGVRGIVLVARRKERLEKIAKELSERHTDLTTHIVSADLSTENGLQELFNSLKEKNIEIDLLVNNAGYGSFGMFHESDIHTETKMIDLNCKAVVALSHYCLAHMKKNRFGGIINVSSMASFQALPFLSVYAATKAFVTSYSVALSCELEGYNIDVQAVCPGPVETEFGAIAHFPDKISVTASMTSQEVVDQSLASFSKGRRITIPGVGNWILSQLPRLLPRAIASQVAMRVLRSKFASSGLRP